MLPISMRGFAEVSAAPAKSKIARLRKYRFPSSGESKGRANYYVKALSAIRHHHHGKSLDFDRVLKDLTAATTTGLDGRARGKAANNLRAVNEYLKHFADRKLKPLKGKRMYFQHKDLSVSAQPDLVGEENGLVVLIKFNFSKDDYPSGVAGVMLHVLHEAANLSGLSLASSQVEYIHACSGWRLCGPKGGFESSTNLTLMADELIALWATVA